jgi:hypothetical protein
MVGMVKARMSWLRRVRAVRRSERAKGTGRTEASRWASASGEGALVEIQSLLSIWKPVAPKVMRVVMRPRT